MTSERLLRRVPSSIRIRCQTSLILRTGKVLVHSLREQMKIYSFASWFIIFYIILWETEAPTRFNWDPVITGWRSQLSDVVAISIATRKSYCLTRGNLACMHRLEIKRSLSADVRIRRTPLLAAWTNQGASWILQWRLSIFEQFSYHSSGDHFCNHFRSLCSVNYPIDLDIKDSSVHLEHLVLTGYTKSGVEQRVQWHLM